jgi:hypothetical protein
VNREEDRLLDVHVPGVVGIQHVVHGLEVEREVAGQLLLSNLLEHGSEQFVGNDRALVDTPVLRERSSAKLDAGARLGAGRCQGSQPPLPRFAAIDRDERMAAERRVGTMAARWLARRAYF